jgi:hypothetical protein
MESMHPSAAAYHPVNLHELKWSPGEKGVARKVFDQALQRELDAITQEVKRRARDIKVGVGIVGAGRLSERKPQKDQW